jgi:replicative DNA helicase
MSEKYDFSEGIQKMVVSMLLYDSLSLVQNREIVKPEFLDHPVLRVMVETLYSFYDKYKRQPNMDEMLEETKLEMERKKIPTTEWVDIFEEVIQIGHEAGFEYVKDKATDFARFQATKEAVITGAKLLQSKKDYSSIMTMVKEAMALGENIDDLGVFYFEETEERLRKRRDLNMRCDLAIATGIDKLDQGLGGGVAPGELGIIMSPMKRGKTMTVVCFGVGALANYKNVLHVGMEGDQDRTQVLYDASISGVPKEQLREREEEVMEAIDYFTNQSSQIGKLVIKHYPAQSCSSMTIEALIQTLKFTTGFEPDLLVIDYLGLMRSANKNLKIELSSGGRYHLLGAITKELLALAQEHKVAIWLLHQTTRGSKSKEIIDLDDSGDSIEPMRDADLILTLNQTKDEADPDLNPQRMRIFIAGGREMKDRRQIDLLIDKSVCRVYEEELEPSGFNPQEK